ncbi:DUF4190 domain-containing protein [Nonomuraea sp. H19]|uniref:DUF4190 domain-containing protein n=1 Tax=Nonomuraea sp. H19 TaxID=3452206 RepID=UPI003F88E454
MSYGDQGGNGGYGAQPSGGGYGQQPPSHGGYGQQPPSYGGYGPQPGYGQQPPSYPQTPLGYGQLPPSAGFSQPGGYAQYGPPPQPRPINGMAVAALILGIVGLITCGLTSIPGVIVGHLSLSRIKRTAEEGQGMAVAGLVTSYIMVAIGAILWLWFGSLILSIIGLGAAASTATYE